MAKARAGWERKIYYGTAGSAAATQLTHATDVDVQKAKTRVETTDRGDGSSVPRKTEQVVQRECQISFKYRYWDSDAVISALIAIVSYAIAPAVRYGMAGMAHVPVERIEAAAMTGCTRGQTFRLVQLPAALPTLLLGLNQTVMMALSMLVIAALVGTRELGQEVFTALSRGETGPGIVAGLCVACIALVADALLKAGVARAAKHQGGAHV